VHHQAEPEQVTDPASTVDAMDLLRRLDHRRRAAFVATQLLGDAERGAVANGEHVVAVGASAETVVTCGSSTLARLFSLVQLGDYVSLYLALLYGVDPTPVEAIESFKRHLAGEAGD